MKKLLIARHGDYNHNSRLSGFGKVQMTDLAKHIQSYSNGNSVHIFSSTAPRALDSAEVVADILAVNIEEVEELCNDDRHYGDLEKSYEIIKAVGDKADVVIVITHLEFTEYLPEYFLKDLDINHFCEMVNKGEAWEIDFENREVKRVPR